jgi:hypothetical protein
LKPVEKWEIGGKGVRESNGRIEQTKVKYTHSGHTFRHPFEQQVKITKIRTLKYVQCLFQGN